MAHVGIVDINKAFESLEPETRQEVAELYALPGAGAYAIYGLRLSVEQDVVHHYRSSRGLHAYDESYQRIWWEDLHQLQNSFYPAIPDGFIGKLANTRAWSRLLGVPQLSWDRDYPLANEHSRGMHSLFVAVNIARVLQALHDKSPEKLVQRLSEDFMREQILSGNETDDEILELGAKLGALVGMSHDLYTPAGGDMMKHIVGIDEEVSIERLKTHAENEFEAGYLAALREYDLGEKHVKFLIDCVQGRSRTLLGEMIHSEDEDILEQDRLAYTVQDLMAAGVLDLALPRSFFADEGEIDEAILIARYQKAQEVLSDSHRRSLGPLSIGMRIPSMTQLDVTEDYMLDESLSLVCTRPDKLLWLAALRAMMSAEFYQGPKLRGQEHDFSEVIKRWMKSPGFNSLLNDDNLLISTNAELGRQFSSLNIPEISEFLKDMSLSFYPHSYEDQLVDDASGYGEEWQKLPIKIKPGLDTKVLHEGEVISLREYAEMNKDSAAAQLLFGILDKYKGKTRVIRRSESSFEL